MDFWSESVFVLSEEISFEVFFSPIWSHVNEKEKKNNRTTDAHVKTVALLWSSTKQLKIHCEVNGKTKVSGKWLTIG